MSETPELKQEMTLNAIPEKKPPKTIEEQLAALEAKKKAIQEREKKLKARQAKKEREARTHRICIIGAAVESAMGKALNVKNQEDGNALIKALKKSDLKTILKDFME